jgi:hypothetical protein
MRTTWPEIAQPQRENRCIFFYLPVPLLASGLFSLPAGGFFAHRLKDGGIDVVIGLFETDGRADIAKVAEGLEFIARRR